MTIYNIIHGPEFWLAVFVWGIGAFCGIAAAWAAIEISDRREEDRQREPDSFVLDNPGGSGRGAAPRSPADRERGGRR